VEVGKIGVWTSEQVRKQRPDISYHHFILNENVADSNISLFKTAMDHFSHVIAQAQEDGALKLNVLPFTEVKRAYRQLASGKSIGKILLDFNGHHSEDEKFRIEKDPESFSQQTLLSFKSDRTYLITGGVGQIGEAFVRYLLQKGARHIVLLGRRPLNETIMKVLEEGLKYNGLVTYEQCDVAETKDLEVLARKLKAHYLPVGGIIHAAGALADSLLENVSRKAIETVFKPKIAGLENLLQHFDPQQLDFLLLFSSVASVLGSATQGVYAAANSYFDTAVLSLPKTFTVNWGPWKGGGMAETISEAAKKRKERLGVQYMSAAEAMKYFEDNLGLGSANLILCPLNWEKFLDTFRTQPQLFIGLKK
jgi:myxalamid-type polyketide synthase MxaB